MKGSYLSDLQIEMVSEILKKYGIESQGLLDELTDHFSGQIEERMKNGVSFNEAFDEFVANNSWLKLRKLEHAYVRYKEKSLRSFILSTLKDLWLSPKVFIIAASIYALLMVIRLDGDWKTVGLTCIHLALFLQFFTLSISALFRFRKRRSQDFGIMARYSFSFFYLLAMPLWLTDSTPITEIYGNINDWVLLGYYALLLQVAYLHLSVFRRASGWEAGRTMLY